MGTTILASLLRQAHQGTGEISLLDVVMKLTDLLVEDLQTSVVTWVAKEAILAAGIVNLRR